jgi:enoyl-CoA hydratase
LEEDAVVGGVGRRGGVPLIDGGTARLPHIVGLGRALDLILTGRPVGAEEALALGFANRVVPSGQGRAAAEQLAAEIAAFPQACVRADRAGVYAGLGRPVRDALAAEFEYGAAVLQEAVAGAAKFASGEGRHGTF